MKKKSSDTRYLKNQAEIFLVEAKFMQGSIFSKIARYDDILQNVVVKISISDYFYQCICAKPETATLNVPYYFVPLNALYNTWRNHIFE